MPASATQIFEFLQNRPSFSNERHELSLAEFGLLRRSLRSIVVKLRDGGDQEGNEISERLRNHLSEWLTVPVRFPAFVRCAIRSGIALGTRYSGAIRLRIAGGPVTPKHR